ncbi:armadillo repeat-containing protein 12-like [Varanus komodoensis]|uniref:armadillo repeat-containing protein 12-like n=1 Tax=Varanus komodoensis TaxID=61221 RepID=UPI001CF79287|nr:armadillo repeat-containing protein 12-like [Varanus komodoensis]
MREAEESRARRGWRSPSEEGKSAPFSLALYPSVYKARKHPTRKPMPGTCPCRHERPPLQLPPRYPTGNDTSYRRWPRVPLAKLLLPMPTGPGARLSVAAVPMAPSDWPLISSCAAQPDCLRAPDKVMKYSELITRKNVANGVIGASAIYLVSKALLAMLQSPPFNLESSESCGIQGDRHSIEYYPIPSVRAKVPGELRRLLLSLTPSLDANSKRTVLNTITQCIHLKEEEANACTHDDIKLVASFLDDEDKVTQTEALNALKAFTAIWRFKIKIQEYVPKIVELVTSNWDANMQVAGLRLLNGLHIPDQTHPLLKRVLLNFMDILFMANTLAKVQVLKFLTTIAQKEDLLYDLMNCRAPPQFLSFIQPSLPTNLLYEMLVFVERLNEGRLSPQYQSAQWQYEDQSIHEMLFGNNSRLSNCLLALITHPEEEIQVQACKVILSLRLDKDENRVIGGLPFRANLSAYPLESTRISQVSNSTLSNHPFIPNTLSTDSTDVSDTSHDGNGRSFHPLQGTDATGPSFRPLQGTDETSQSFHPLERADHSFHPLENIRANSGSRVLDDARGGFLPLQAGCPDDGDNNT